MKCPECGDKDAKQVELFTSYSYLCAGQSCKHFDHDYAVKLCDKAFNGYHIDEPIALPNTQGYLLPDGLEITFED